MSFFSVNFFAFFWQIGELLRGNFNWRGLFHFLLFVVMALIIVGLGAFVGARAFRSKNKDDV